MLDWLKDKQLLIMQLGGYMMAGLVATVADMGTLYIVTESMGVHYLLATVIGFIVGLIVSYLLCVIYVFKKRRIDNPMAEFLIFALIGVIGVGLTTLTMWFLTSILGVYYMFSKLLAIGLVFIFNFGMRKLLLFK